MRKVSKFFRGEFIYLKDFFWNSERGPLFGVMLFVIAVAATTLLTSPNSINKSTPAQISSGTPGPTSCSDGWDDVNGDFILRTNVQKGTRVKAPYSGQDWICCGTNEPGNTEGWINGTSCTSSNGLKQNGEACFSDTQCVSGICHEYTFLNRKCIDPLPEGAACTQDRAIECRSTVCNVAIGGIGTCAGNNGPFDDGHSCYSNTQCKSNYCGIDNKCKTNASRCEAAYDIPSDSWKTEGTICGNSSNPTQDPTKYIYNCVQDNAGRWGWTPTGQTCNPTTGPTVCDPAYDVQTQSWKTTGTICGNSSNPTQDPTKYIYNCVHQAVGKDTWITNGQTCNANGPTSTPRPTGGGGNPTPTPVPSNQTGCGVTATGTQCGNGNIIQWQTGAAICNNYTGNAGDSVCGADHQNWKCNGSSKLWEPIGGSCGCPGTNQLACGGICHGVSGNPSNYECKNGVPVQKVGPSSTPIPTPTTNPYNPTPTTGAATGTPTKTPTPTSTSATATPTSIAATGTPTSTPTGGPTATNTPTATSVPGTTNLIFELAIDAVGKDTSIGENNSPTPSSQNVQVQIFDTNSNKVAENSGTVNYDATSGTFKGKVPVNIATGAYNIKARFLNTLWKKISKKITAGTDNGLPWVRLVNGDINQDNQLNLLDYTLLISCMNNKPCTQKTASDLNFDGQVNTKDLNLLYFHFKNREGD